MNTLKKGDIVVCTTLRFGDIKPRSITQYKQYVLFTDENYLRPFYMITNDVGITSSHLKGFFTPLVEYRLETIKNIINA